MNCDLLCIPIRGICTRPSHKPDDSSNLLSTHVYTFSWFSYKKTRLTLLCLSLLSVAKNLHYVWTSDFQYDDRTGAAMCAFGLTRKSTWVRVWQWIDLCLASLIPFLILICLNLAIVITLRRTASSRHALTADSSHSSSSKQRDAQLTAMLISVSIMFVVLTAPLFMFRTYFNFVPHDGDIWSEAIYYLGHHICHKLWYCNNAVNFYLYCITGKKFRDDLLSLCRRPTDRGGTSSTTSVTSM